MEPVGPVNPTQVLCASVCTKYGSPKSEPPVHHIRGRNYWTAASSEANW